LVQYAGGEMIAKTRKSTVTKNTWGDGLYLVFFKTEFAAGSPSICATGSAEKMGGIPPAAKLKPAYRIAGRSG